MLEHWMTPSGLMSVTDNNRVYNFSLSLTPGQTVPTTLDSPLDQSINYPTQLVIFCFQREVGGDGFSAYLTTPSGWRFTETVTSDMPGTKSVIRMVFTTMMSGMVLYLRNISVTNTISLDVFYGYRL